ncbi:hypothetical protein D3C73_660720 [compost metagenome]
MWDDGPVPSPYLNQRCILGYAGCDSESQAINKPQVVDDKGFYGVMGAAYGWTNGLLSPSFYNYLRTMDISATLTRTVNACWTDIEYDARSGARCKNQETGNWYKGEQKHTKAAHLTLHPNNIVSEVIIDSNGSPIILPGSQGCNLGTVYGVEGVICKFIDYELRHNGAPLNTAFIRPKITNSTLLSKINATDFLFSSDQTSWVYYTLNMSLEYLKNQNSIYLFLSKTMLKSMTELNMSNVSTQDLIEFTMTNGLAPESGYYEFGASAEVTIKPRQFNVSILASDGGPPYREGEVGKDILSFPYNISDSGPTGADALSISVKQDNGSPYQGNCTFYPADQITVEKAVPVPTRLVFDSAQQGKDYQHPIRCDSTPVDIRSLGIQDSQAPLMWTDPNGDSGIARFYTLALEFDLTDPMTQRTTTGDMWEGDAQQSGTITINGNWH